MKFKRILLIKILPILAMLSLFALSSCSLKSYDVPGRAVNISYLSNGVMTKVDFPKTPPFITDENIIMIPAAPMVEAYNKDGNPDKYDLTWDDEAKKLTIVKNDDYSHRVEFIEGVSSYKFYYTNEISNSIATGQPTVQEVHGRGQLEAKVETINGYVYIPIKYGNTYLEFKNLFQTTCKFDNEDNTLYIGETLYPFNIQFKDENGQKIVDDIEAKDNSDIPLPTLDDTEDKRFAGWKALLPNGEYNTLNEWPSYPYDAKDESTYKNFISENDRKEYVKNGLRYEYDYSWVKTMTLQPIWYDPFPKEEDYASLPDKEFVVPEDEKAVLESYYDGYLRSTFGIVSPGTIYAQGHGPAPYGLISKYISDFDNDSHAEMIALCAVCLEDPKESGAARSVGYGYKQNVYLQIYEIGADGQPYMSNEVPVLNNYFASAARRDVFVHQYNNENYICAVSACTAAINNSLKSEYYLFKYNGSNFERVMYLYTSGSSDEPSTLYSVPIGAEDHSSDKALHPGEYYSYNDAIMYEGIKYGLKTVDYGEWKYTKKNYDGTTSEESQSFPLMYTADNAVWLAAVNDTCRELSAGAGGQIEHTVSVSQ